MAFTYDLANADEDIVALSKVRLLLNDVDQNTPVFTDAEITAFLDMEGGSIKLAAAQAIDTNADDQALASKVLRTQDVQTDGAKLADALRKRAAELRRQAEDEDEAYFEIVPMGETCGPELTGSPVPGWWV